MLTTLRRETLGWWWTVLAPNTITAVLSAALLIIMVSFLTLHHLVWDWWASRLADYSGALDTFIGTSTGLATFYGLMRAVGFHPALDYRYHGWLRASPWSPGRPLPKGPITPVWQDALLLTLLTLAHFYYSPATKYVDLTTILPALGMAAGLALGWTAANVVTRNELAVYAALLTMPVVGIAGSSAPPAVGVTLGLIATAMVAYLGVLRGMAGYPWEVFPRDKNYLKNLFSSAEHRTLGWQGTATVGWPYTHLLTPPKDYRAPAAKAAAEALAVALWIAYFGLLIENPRYDEFIWALVGQLGLGLTIGRFIFNTPLMCPKLCLGERVAKWRPIVWRHDRLLLEPLAVGGTMWAVAWVWIEWLDWKPGWAGAALTAALGVWLCRRISRPVDERFYTGAQSIAGVNPQGAVFKKLAAPGD